MPSQVFISSLKASSKFVSCVDIEEEVRDEIGVNVGVGVVADPDTVEPQNLDAKVELGHNVVEATSSSSADARLKALEGEPTFFQYFFGCLPCVAKPSPILSQNE